MTTYWTARRWITLAVHAALALLLLAWSTSSSLHFWRFVFTDPIYSYGALSCIDGLALLGLLLHLARIQSPIAAARHALPLVSAVPLGYDMHGQFVHFANALTWVFTIGVTALLVALSFVVWRTIEQLFISPVQAAQDYATEQMQGLQLRAAQLQVMQRAADDFVQQHQQRALNAIQPAQLPMQSYARVAEPTQPVLHVPAPLQNDSARRDTDRLPDLPATFICVKCGATNEAPAGKDPIALRKASGRYGCPQCKHP